MSTKFLKKIKFFFENVVKQTLILVYAVHIATVYNCAILKKHIML